MKTNKLLKSNYHKIFIFFIFFVMSCSTEKSEEKILRIYLNKDPDSISYEKGLFTIFDNLEEILDGIWKFMHDEKNPPNQRIVMRKLLAEIASNNLDLINDLEISELKYNKLVDDFLIEKYQETKDYNELSSSISLLTFRTGDRPAKILEENGFIENGVPITIITSAEDWDRLMDRMKKVSIKRGIKIPQEENEF